MQTVEALWQQLFFFSSRRRHTRYIGDWSSDVCSSDLGGGVGGGLYHSQTNTTWFIHEPGLVVLAPGTVYRSEERRVGKARRPVSPARVRNHARRHPENRHHRPQPAEDWAADDAGSCKH